MLFIKVNCIILYNYAGFGLQMQSTSMNEYFLPLFSYYNAEEIMFHDHKHGAI